MASAAAAARIALLSGLERLLWKKSCFGLKLTRRQSPAALISRAASRKVLTEIFLD